jgi:hypothetical protein
MGDEADDVAHEHRRTDMPLWRIASASAAAGWRTWLVAVLLAVLVPAGLAAVVASAVPAPPRTGALAPGDRAARFDAFIASLRLDAAQSAEAKAMFAKARATAAQNPDRSARSAEYRLLMQQALTTLRGALRPDQRSVLDAARAREAAADLRLAQSTKARLDRFVSALALTTQQQAVAFPIIATAVKSAGGTAYNKALFLELGYRKAFKALTPTLSPEQRRKLDAARVTKRRSAGPLSDRQTAVLP